MGHYFSPGEEQAGDTDPEWKWSLLPLHPWSQVTMARQMSHEVCGPPARLLPSSRFHRGEERGAAPLSEFFRSFWKPLPSNAGDRDSGMEWEAGFGGGAAGSSLGLSFLPHATGSDNSIFFVYFFHLLVLEREERDRERFVVSLIHPFLGWFLQPWWIRTALRPVGPLGQGLTPPSCLHKRNR